MNPKGKTIGVWVSGRLLTTFLAHVPTGSWSDWGSKAFEEKLEREGAFAPAPDATATALLKSLPPASLPVLLEFAELLSTRGVEAVRAKLDELTLAAAETAGGDRESAA